MRELGSRDWDVRAVLQLPPDRPMSVIEDVTACVVPFLVEYDPVTSRVTLTDQVTGLSYPRLLRLLDDLWFRFGASPERIVELSLTAREE